MKLFLSGMQLYDVPRRWLPFMARKVWQLVYDAVFLAGIGVVLVALTLRLLPPDHRILMVAMSLAVLSWVFFSAAILKANFFENAAPGRKAMGNSISLLIVALLLGAGWYYGLWEKAPKLYLLRIPGVLADRRQGIRQCSCRK